MAKITSFLSERDEVNIDVTVNNGQFFFYFRDQWNQDRAAVSMSNAELLSLLTVIERAARMAS